MIAFLLAGALAASPDPAELDRRARELFATYATRTPRQSAELMAGIVEQGPFPERPRMMVWLGTQYLALGDRGEAGRWLERARREHPGDPWAAKALFGLGEIAAARHRYLTARDLFLEAAATSPEDRDDAMSRVARVRDLFWRFVVVLVAAAILALFALRAATGFVRALPRPAPPFEVKLMAPAAGAFAALALLASPEARLAVWIVSCGMVTLLWLNALALAARPRLPALHIAHAVLAAAALVYGALWQSGLIDPALETLRRGPER